MGVSFFQFHEEGSIELNQAIELEETIKPCAKNRIEEYSILKQGPFRIDDMNDTVGIFMSDSETNYLLITPSLDSKILQLTKFEVSFASFLPPYQIGEEEE